MRLLDRVKSETAEIAKVERAALEGRQMIMILATAPRRDADRIHESRSSFAPPLLRGGAIFRVNPC